MKIVKKWDIQSVKKILVAKDKIYAISFQAMVYEFNFSKKGIDWDYKKYKIGFYNDTPLSSPEIRGNIYIQDAFVDSDNKINLLLDDNKIYINTEISNYFIFKEKHIIKERNKLLCFAYNKNENKIYFVDKELYYYSYGFDSKILKSTEIKTYNGFEKIQISKDGKNLIVKDRDGIIHIFNSNSNQNGDAKLGTDGNFRLFKFNTKADGVFVEDSEKGILYIKQNPKNPQEYAINAIFLNFKYENDRYILNYDIINFNMLVFILVLLISVIMYKYLVWSKRVKW